MTTDAAATPPAQRVTQPRTARNVLLSWAAFAFNVVVSFFLSPFIVHTLGNAEYGVWVLLGSLVGYMGLLDLGVRSAVMRYIARHHARVEDEEAGRVASAGLAIFAATGLVAFTASIVIAVGLVHLFTIPRDILLLARVVVVIGGLNVAVSLVSGVFGGAVTAMQRFDLDAVIGIVLGVVRLVALVAALSAGGGLLALALIQLGITALQGAAYFVLTGRLYPQLRYSFRGLDRGQLKKIFAFSIYSSLINLSGVLIFSVDSVVIGAYLPVATITFFAIAATLMDYTRSVISAISQTLTPRASALDGLGERKELERILVQAGAVSSLVALPITITFLIRGGAFIGLWMGPGYRAPSEPVLIILAVALSLAAGRQVVGSTMIGVNRHRDLVPFYLAEGLVNLGLSIYWVRSLGLVGVALGTAIPNLVTTLLVSPWMVHRVLGTPRRALFTALWLRPIAAMVPFAAATWPVEHFHAARHLATFFAGILLVLPVAAAGAWFIGLPAADRRTFAAVIARRLRPAAARS